MQQFNEDAAEPSLANRKPRQWRSSTFGQWRWNEFES